LPKKTDFFRRQFMAYRTDGQYMSLVFALKRFVGLDEGARMARGQRMAEAMCAGLQGIDGVEVGIDFPTHGRGRW